jgi:D-alanyl-D-alanine dipeptidase
VFARVDVVKAVRHAQQSLPEGHHIIVFDSYRSLEVQKALYDHYLSALKAQNPDWSNEELSTET